MNWLRVLRFAMSNGISRTIVESMMYLGVRERLDLYETWDAFLMRELGEDALESLLEKFWQEKNAARREVVENP